MRGATATLARSTSAPTPLYLSGSRTLFSIFHPSPATKQSGFRTRSCNRLIPVPQLQETNVSKQLLTGCAGQLKLWKNPNKAIKSPCKPNLGFRVSGLGLSEGHRMSRRRLFRSTWPHLLGSRWPGSRIRTESRCQDWETSDRDGSPTLQPTETEAPA